jgi:hypothetical protein
VLELGYNAERHDLQQLYITAKQLDEAKLYTSIYNKAAMQGDQQHAVKAIRPTRMPARASIQVSRPPANKSLPVYRPAIPVVAGQPPPRPPYPATAKPAVGIRPGPPPVSTGNSAMCHNCGQPGHFKANCPQVQPPRWVAGVRLEANTSNGEVEDTSPEEDFKVVNQDQPQGEGNEVEYEEYLMDIPCEWENEERGRHPGMGQSL